MNTLSEHASLGASILRDSSALLSDVYKCPEFAKGEWENLAAGPPWAIDSWGLGCLIREVFGNGSLGSPADLRDISCIPEDLLKDYQRLLNSQGQKRLNPQRLLKNRYLHNQLVEVVSFLESLAVKEATEKSTFFKKLTQSLSELPDLVVHQKILPMVIDALEFGSASPNALSCVMKIADGMDGDQFQSSIAPAMIRFFNSTDRTIRRVLLENIDKFGDRLPAAMIDETIYPALSNGFTDSNAYLRELTLKSMLHFAGKLSQKTLNQSLLKFLARLQVDPEPSIRANTTVLLGFIADHLGEASCKRILLNAFNRALKDQFPPARLAGLKALVTTRKYYTSAEVANKVIPCTSPLCIDGVEDVRNQALTCLETFVRVLREETTVTEEGSESQVAVSNPKTTSISQNYVSWAVSSLGFSQITEPETKSEPKLETRTEARVAELNMPSHTSSPLKLSEKSHDAFRDTSSRAFSSNSSSEDDRWDLEDEDDFGEIDAKHTRPSTKPTSKTTDQGSSNDHRSVTRGPKEEHDVWDDLDMRATMPTEPPAVQRRKPKGSGKPMKLGAKKLS